MEYEPIKDLFLNDIYLSRLVDEIDEYKIISFDVFDTLLFRAVYEPTDIFLKLGSRLNEQFYYNQITPEIFKGFRIRAETSAREKAATQYEREDIKLIDIYKELSKVFKDYNVAMQKEIDIEKEYCYLNPNIYSFIQYCFEAGKKVILVSDFYFSEVQFRGLLEYAGLDFRYISDFFISSEYGVGKWNGKLFQCLLKKFPQIKSEKILHIGDNIHSDVWMARKHGLNAEWYAVVPETSRGIFALEWQFGKLAGGIKSLRGLAAHSIPDEYRAINKRFWFETGSSVIGCVYTFFAEWVIDESLKRGIKKILAFMREGELLAEVINRAAKNRGVEIRAVPFYISRQAVLLLRFDQIDESVMEKYYFNNKHLTIKDLFSNFYINADETPFREINKKTVLECERKGIFDSVKKYLSTESILRELNKIISEQRMLLVKYIISLIGEEKSATIDIGYNGTMQNCIDNVLSRCGYKDLFYHMIILGFSNARDLLIEGLNINGWLSFGSEGEDLGARAPVLESMVTANIGKTLRYYEDENIVGPVLDTVCTVENNRRNKEILWQGIFNFQKHWFWLSSKKPSLLKEVINDKMGFLYMVRRFMRTPNYIEAFNVGSLNFDDSTAFSMEQTLCAQFDFEVFNKRREVEYFLTNPYDESGKPIIWPEAIVENKIPGYFMKKYLGFPGDIFSKMQLLNGKNMAIYGAGRRGKVLAEMAFAMGLSVPFIVDNAKERQGSFVYGYPIVSQGHSIGKTDVYIITPKGFEVEIKEELIRLHKGLKQPEFIFYDLSIE